MKYAFGELRLFSEHDNEWGMCIGQTVYKLSNSTEIPDNVRFDGNIFLCRYLEEDQFATYIPVEKIEYIRLKD